MNMKTKCRTLAVLSVLLFAGSGVPAAPEEWALTDGTMIAAELVNVMSDYALFKDTDGDMLKIELDRFSPESLIRIQLGNPPRLAFDLIKDNDTKVFTAGINYRMIRPPEERNSYGIRVKQQSTTSYDHPLNIEVFIIGRERLGDKFILLDRFSSSFKLTNENRREFEFRSDRKVVLQNYEVVGTKRGEDYYGYLAVVKDLRGVTIAHSASHDWLFENLENLSDRYVGNFMDKTCTRVFPTRPPSQFH